MINYKKDLIELIKNVAGDVPVFTQYPSANIVPAIIVYETSNVLINNFPTSEHASVSFVIEVYAKDIPARDDIVAKVDDMLLEIKFVRTLYEEADTPTLYAKKLGYSAELKLNKATQEIRIYNNN